jgi:hypothetical protein
VLRQVAVRIVDERFTAAERVGARVDAVQAVVGVGRRVNQRVGQREQVAIRVVGERRLTPDRIDGLGDRVNRPAASTNRIVVRPGGSVAPTRSTRIERWRSPIWLITSIASTIERAATVILAD